jgi:hypothetical protein
MGSRAVVISPAACGGYSLAAGTTSNSPGRGERGGEPGSITCTRKRTCPSITAVRGSSTGVSRFPDGPNWVIPPRTSPCSFMKTTRAPGASDPDLTRNSMDPPRLDEPGTASSIMLLSCATSMLVPSHPRPRTNNAKDRPFRIPSSDHHPNGAHLGRGA